MTRKALGRGLDALIRPAPARPEPIPEPGERVISISVDAIIPNPRQPRREFDDARLAELAQSIREKGILEPLIVRPGSSGDFELVAGERRLRASRLAGLTEVPVLVRDFNEVGSLEVALIENLQREDLNPVDEARAYQRLAEEFGRTHGEISEQVGKDRSTITNLLRLLRLPEPVLALVSRGTLSVGHARVLLALETPEEQITLAQRIGEEAWSVRQAEKFVGEVSQAGRPKPSREKAPKQPERSREIQRVEEALRYRLGTEVHLTHGPSGAGRIEIRYASLEELERILDILQAEVH